MGSHTGTIIDYGAGTGRLALPLSRDYNVITVEISAGMAKVLSDKVQSAGAPIEIHNCSIADYRNSKGDLALSLQSVLTYMKTEEELSASIKNIAEHLVPGGGFLFDLPEFDFFLGTAPIYYFDSLSFSRFAYMRNTDQKDLYIYHENTSGITEIDGKMDGFYYESEFFARYWALEDVDAILREHGFQDSEMDLHIMDYCGSLHKYYTKI